MYVNKKPMNVVSGPIYPFIQKDSTSRFQSAGKHWEVHTDDIIRGQADNPQAFDGSILAVSRQENQYRYGKNSYTPKIKTWRYPLVDPEYDLVPLSRTPRPRTQVRFNPDASDVAQSQNIHGTDVSSFIDTRVLKGSVRPSFVINMPAPRQEDKYPDLKLNRPHVAGYTGINTPTNAENVRCEYDLPDNNPRVYANSSVNAPMQIDAPSAFENLELTFNKPNVSAMSGVNVPFEYTDNTTLDEIELQFNRPQTSATSGIQTGISFMNEEKNYDLKYNRPQTSMRSNPGIKMSSMNEKTDIKTQNPISINYQTTRNSNLTKSTANKNPNLRPVLQYDRSFQPTCTVPSFGRNQAPVMLRNKK